MKKRRVYIAGPISRGDLLANIDQATAAFTALARAGLAPFCPHWSVYSKPAEREGFKVLGSRGLVPSSRVICEATTQGNPGMSHADWIGIDLAWVEVSDVLLRLPGPSAGADQEVAHATLLGIPVFHSVAQVIEWDAQQRTHDAWVAAALKDEPGPVS